jgi:hypothetical protein
VTESHVQILLIAGPAAVGKSTLSWEISVQLRRVGCPHVVLDSDELDRVWPLSGEEQERLNRANLRAFWANASTLGHDRLVLAGVFLDPDAYRGWVEVAIPGSSIKRVVLQASDDELERRVRAREIGSEVDDQVARTLTQAHRFRRRNTGSTDVLNTEGTTVPELARLTIERAGWAGVGRR